MGSPEERTGNCVMKITYFILAVADEKNIQVLDANHH